MDFGRRSSSYCISYDLTTEQMVDWANMMGIEAVVIDKDTNIRDFRRNLLLGDIVYK